MKIIINSGAGCMGSAVVRHRINETNSQTLVRDSLTYVGNLESLATMTLIERCKFEQIDICKRPEPGRFFAEYQPGMMIHLATEIQVKRSIDDQVTFIETNHVDTFTLLETAVQCWQNLDDAAKKVLGSYPISADEVHGDPHGTNGLFTEFCFMRPVALTQPRKPQVTLRY